MPLFNSMSALPDAGPANFGKLTFSGGDGGGDSTQTTRTRTHAHARTYGCRPFETALRSAAHSSDQWSMTPDDDDEPSLLGVTFAVRRQLRRRRRRLVADRSERAHTHTLVCVREWLADHMCVCTLLALRCASSTHPFAHLSRRSAGRRVCFYSSSSCASVCVRACVCVVWQRFPNIRLVR